MTENLHTTNDADMAQAIELLERLGQKAKAYAERSDIHDAIFSDVASYIDKAVHALASRTETEI